MEVDDQCYAPSNLPLGKRPGTHHTGGWVSPRAGLEGCRKFYPPPGFDPLTVQLVASYYADCAVLALHQNFTECFFYFFLSLVYFYFNYYYYFFFWHILTA